MALRVLTQEEKLNLSNNSTFRDKCKQAVRDFSVYWAANDGTAFSTEADRVMWAKNRINGVKFVKNPIINEDSLTLAWFFLNAAKGKTYDLGAAPVADITLNAAWDTENSFDEFVASYFAIKGDEIDMTSSGN